MKMPEVYNASSGQPRKNILNSLLWLTGVTFPSGTLALTFGPWPITLIPFVIGSLSPLAALYYYRHWSNREPDRLQTEGYNLQKNAMTILGSGGDETIIENDPKRMIDNPSKGEKS